MASRPLNAVARQRASNPVATKSLETSLYSPVKRYLEKLGFRVKGEICGCDLVALREDGPSLVVVGELKLSFKLELCFRASIGFRRAMKSGSRSELRTGERSRTRSESKKTVPLARLWPVGRFKRRATSSFWSNRDHGGPDAIQSGRSQLVREHQRRLGDPVQAAVQGRRS